ncbi:MAG: hypothetical protein ABSF88_04350 [Candidatus Aminicenantales bacterium]
MRFPFEAPISEIDANLDDFVDAIFSSLESEFLVMPKGDGFVEYDIFEQGYEAIKRETDGFKKLDPDLVEKVAKEKPITIIVLRTILGFSPPEWAYVASQRSGIEIPQGAVRSLDRNIRLKPEIPLKVRGLTAERIRALIKVACELIGEGVSSVPPDYLHRLDKADTKAGLASVRSAAQIGIPYAMLLYERFLGRPFAGHRDSISDLVGGSFEVAIEEVLSKSGISFQKTKRAERLAALDQTPDFVIPDQFAPQVVIEAKVCEDDGTARDKVTRILRLVTLSNTKQEGKASGFEVIACLSGRGFAQRREDMRRLIRETKGKVFTPQTLNRLVDSTRLKKLTTNRFPNE